MCTVGITGKYFFMILSFLMLVLILGFLPPVLSITRLFSFVGGRTLQGVRKREGSVPVVFGLEIFV